MRIGMNGMMKKMLCAELACQHRGCNLLDLLGDDVGATAKAVIQFG